MSEMGDGAHLGVSAERALGSILGNEGQPSDDERRDPDQMRLYLLSAPDDPETYDEAARCVGKRVLTAFLEEPALASMPTETVFDWDGYNAATKRGENVVSLRDHVKEHGLYDALEERGITMPEGITGFQWGWGVNAARYCVELPPAANPAIIPPAANPAIIEVESW